MKKRSGKKQPSSRSRKATTRRNQTARSEYESGHEPGMSNGLHALFLKELADVLSAEQQLTKALPKMAKAAESEELREAFEEHLQQTEEQIYRIAQVFESLGEKMQRKTCKAMQGLIEEGSEVIQEHKGCSAIDAALIAAAQKVEHYEIASYGTLCAWAERMGHMDALDLLKETINEEETTDQRLTELAENIANERAEQG